MDAVTTLVAASTRLGAAIQPSAAVLRARDQELTPLAPVSSQAIAARFRTEAAALKTAGNTAVRSNNLLGAARDGLLTIRDRLQQAELVVASAKNATLGITGRVLLNDQFLRLLADAEEIATNSSFKGQKLINASQAFNFRIGSGAAAVDVVTVQIDAAKVDDLAPGLSAANLLSSAATTTADTLLTTAQATLEGQIGGLNRDIERLDAARANAVIGRAGNNAAFEAQLAFQRDLNAADQPAGGVAARELQSYLRLVGVDFSGGATPDALLINLEA